MERYASLPKLDVQLPTYPEPEVPEKDVRSASVHEKPDKISEDMESLDVELSPHPQSEVSQESVHEEPDRISKGVKSLDVELAPDTVYERQGATLIISAPILGLSSTSRIHPPYEVRGNTNVVEEADRQINSVAPGCCMRLCWPCVGQAPTSPTSSF